MTRSIKAKKAKPDAKVWCYDYETVNWDVGLVGVAISEDGTTEVYNRKVTRTKKGALRIADGGCPIAMISEVQRRERGQWWAHYGGGFDHLLSFRANLPQEVILSGSTVLWAKGRPRKGERMLEYRDTAPLMLCSLEKMGAATGAERKDSGFDRSRLEDYSLADVTDYCVQDVKVLWQGLRAVHDFFDEMDVKRCATAGSAAMKLMEKCDDDTWDALETNVLTYDEVVAGREAIRGGRVGNKRVGRVSGPVYSFDIHSSYPSAYFDERPLPVGLKESTSTSLAKEWWLDECEWEIPKLARGAKGYQLTPVEQGEDDAGVTRGVGPMRAWLTSETARRIQAKGYPIRRLGHGFEPTAVVDAFGRHFAEILYKHKEGGGRYSHFAKVFVNAAHGKLCEGPDRVRYVLMYDDMGNPWYDEKNDRYRYRTKFDDAKMRPYQQPMAGAFVLARARDRLYVGIELLERAGFEVHYWDTDCIHTNASPKDAEAAGLNLGPGIGQWGLEYVFDHVWYLAPKSYYGTGYKPYLRELAKKGKQGKDAKSAAKGFEKAKVTEALFKVAWEKFQAKAAAPIARRGTIAKFRTTLDEADREGLNFGRRMEMARSLAPVIGAGMRLEKGRLIYV